MNKLYVNVYNDAPPFLDKITKEEWTQLAVTAHDDALKFLADAVGQKVRNDEAQWKKVLDIHLEQYSIKNFLGILKQKKKLNLDRMSHVTIPSAVLTEEFANVLKYGQAKGKRKAPGGRLGMELNPGEPVFMERQRRPLRQPLPPAPPPAPPAQYWLDDIAPVGQARGRDWQEEQMRRRFNELLAEVDPLYVDPF